MQVITKHPSYWFTVVTLNFQSIQQVHGKRMGNDEKTENNVKYVEHLWKNAHNVLSVFTPQHAKRKRY